MPVKVYDPKEIVNVLISMEQCIENAVSQQSLDEHLSFKDDLEKAMQDFLSRKDLDSDEISFLCTQFAMLHLLKEVGKAKDLVVDVNNLRAFVDFKKRYEKNPYEKTVFENRKMRYIGLILALMIIILLGGLFLFTAYFS